MTISPHPITIPLINPNEPEARLVTIMVKEGQWVSRGEMLFTLETTKSVTDVMADAEGYIAGLRYSVGQILSAGEIFCYLADSPDWKPTIQVQPEALHLQTVPGLPDGLRITQPALDLVRSIGADVSKLPIGPLITVSTVQSLMIVREKREGLPVDSALNSSAILIYGGGGHGKSLIDLLRALGAYQIIGVIDDSLPRGGKILDLPLLGGVEALPGIYQMGVRLAVNAVGGIGSLRTRIEVFHSLEETGFLCPTVIHPTAFIEPSASVEKGVQVFPLAYVGSEAHIGYGAIINTGAIVSHDCILGDYTNISPGAMLAGEVQVGEGVLIGMGATINLRVKVGAGARIGNSATVKENVPEQGIVRAGTTWP